LWGDGSPRREFLHVDDLADAVVFLMKNYDYNDIGEFVNVGTGKDITIEELARLIAEVIGFRGDFRWDTSKPNGTPRKLLDVSRLHALGWHARIPLQAGIEKTYQWYREHNFES
jgi:GDP-L-fucose synthase